MASALFVTAPLKAQGADLDLHAGEYIPGGLTFTDETGQRVVLSDLPEKPTILSLNYYECKDICTPMLTELADALDKIELEPGRDFRVWTVSIDENETPDFARRKKASFLAGMQRPFSDNAWTFFTGDPDNIRALADSVGYSFSRQGDGFIHPGALVILSPDGKIVRYIYGKRYLSLDLEMALMEASDGRVGQTIRKALLTCFRYDPEGKTYTLNVTRIAGVVILLAGSLLFIVLKLKSGKKE